MFDNPLHLILSLNPGPIAERVRQMLYLKSARILGLGLFSFTYAAHRLAVVERQRPPRSSPGKRSERKHVHCDDSHFIESLVDRGRYVLHTWRFLASIVLIGTHRLRY